MFLYMVFIVTNLISSSLLPYWDVIITCKYEMNPIKNVRENVKTCKYEKDPIKNSGENVIT